MKKVLLLLIIPLLFVFNADASSVTKRTVPKKIINLHVVKKTSHSVTIQWKKRPAAKKYQVRVLTKKRKLVKKVLTKKHKIIIKKLKPNTTYKFRVRARKKGKFGKYSKIIKAKTKEETVTPEEQDSDIIEDDDNEDQNSESPSDNEDQDPEPDTPDEEVVYSEIPFGFWGLNGFINDEGLQSVQDDFNATTFQVLSAGAGYNLNTLLPLIQSKNMSVNLNITGNYTSFANESGNFDIDLWNQSLDNYFSTDDIAIGMQEYADNGTLNSIMLLDDMYNYSGDDPTPAELEQMACSLKEKVDVLTYVREDVSYLSDYQFSCLDAAGLQYSWRKGDIDDWAQEQYDAANNLGLDVIFGLNICDGGDGSSEQQGWRGPGYYAMSADEITAYGETLLDYENVIMFLMWEYDGENAWPDGTMGSDYFDNNAQQALYNLGQKAQQYN